MAKSPQKSDDPMADTLNAIEAALKLGDGDNAPAVKSPSEGNGADAPARTEAELHLDEPPQPTWQADETPPRPANDDRANVGQMLQALHQRPASRTPFVLATIADHRLARRRGRPCLHVPSRTAARCSTARAWAQPSPSAPWSR